MERRFSLEKRKCGFGLIMTMLRQTIAHSVVMSILTLNPRKLLRAVLCFLHVCPSECHRRKKNLFN